MKNKIEYKTIKNGYVTKEQAIAIASCDKNLKDSIFKKWKKEKNLYLGWISFNYYDIALVQINQDFAWHIKVKKGEWGGVKVKKIPIIGIYKECENWDGDFTEADNISCFVMCDSGEYHFGNEFDFKQIKAPNMEEYKNYLERNSIYFME